LLNVWGSEKELSVGLSILVVVLNSNTLESLSDGSGGLISSQDTLSWGANLLAGPYQFVFEISTSVSEHLVKFNF
jgi:hypothetical protein